MYISVVEVPALDDSVLSVERTVEASDISEVLTDAGVESVVAANVVVSLAIVVSTSVSVSI